MCSALGGPRDLTTGPFLLAGLGDVPYFGSWFLTHWSSLLLSAALCVGIGTYPFRNTSPTLMLTFFGLFTSALISFRCWQGQHNPVLLCLCLGFFCSASGPIEWP